MFGRGDRIAALSEVNATLLGKLTEAAAMIEKLQESHRLGVEVFARFREDLKLERDRYDALLKEVLALRRDGFNQPATSPAPPPETHDALPAKVLEAIEHVAEGQPALARTLRTDAYRFLDGGADAEEVARLILRGNEPEVAL